MRGGDERIDGAVAPIGNWHQHEVRVCGDDSNAFGNRLGGVKCRERTLEGVRRDDDAHRLR